MYTDKELEEREFQLDLAVLITNASTLGNFILSMIALATSIALTTFSLGDLMLRKVLSIFVIVFLVYVVYETRKGNREINNRKEELLERYVRRHRNQD